MRKSGQSFSNSTEVLDGNEYENCRFENCQIVYAGGEIPRIANCQFSNCRWQFADAAERTLNFMRQVYHGMGTGGSEIIDATLNAIRHPIT